MSEKIVNYQKLGKVVRKQIIDIIDKAGRGHIGPAFSLVEIINVLYEKVLKIDPKNPEWDDRDRFIFSKGHGCLGLYPTLARLGFFPESELEKFCAFDGILGGHPDHQKIPGVEASTGALGHGMSIGVGVALRAKIDKKDYKTFVLIGDGESNEGSNWEAAISAAKHKLDKYVVMIDYNKYQSYDSVEEIFNMEPYADKWRAFGFDVFEADLDFPEKLEKLLLEEIDYNNQRPKMIICHTIKGKGISFVENDLTWHHVRKLDAETINSLKSALDNE